jgi:cytochrome c oxidase cbb3-type subunit 3
MPRPFSHVRVVLLIAALATAGCGGGSAGQHATERAHEPATGSAVTKSPVFTEATLMSLVRDTTALAAGKQTFCNTCAPCHRVDGGGNIGPNLTDDYWIHGSSPQEIVHTITTGVPDRGMPTWGQTLTPEQIGRVAAYVISLHGTHPAHPKGPQGVKTGVKVGTNTAAPSSAN